MQLAPESYVYINGWLTVDLRCIAGGGVAQGVRSVVVPAACPSSCAGASGRRTRHGLGGVPAGLGAGRKAAGHGGRGH